MEETRGATDDARKGATEVARIGATEVALYEVRAEVIEPERALRGATLVER